MHDCTCCSFCYLSSSNNNSSIVQSGVIKSQFTQHLHYSHTHNGCCRNFSLRGDRFTTTYTLYFTGGDAKKGPQSVVVGFLLKAPRTERKKPFSPLPENGLYGRPLLWMWTRTLLCSRRSRRQTKCNVRSKDKEAFKCTTHREGRIV